MNKFERYAPTALIVLIAVMFVLGGLKAKANSVPTLTTDFQEIYTVRTTSVCVTEKRSEYINLGVFRVTAYCPCYECSEGWEDMTSTGVRAKSNHTVAVDPKVIPYGSVLFVNGVEYRAEDCGGEIRNKDLDIYFDTHSEVEAFGVYYLPVFLKVGEPTE